jgi:hypothetical protein
MRLADLEFSREAPYGWPVSQELFNPTNNYVYRVMHHPDLEHEYSLLTVLCPAREDVTTNTAVEGLDFMDIDSFTLAVLLAPLKPFEPY